MEGSSLTMGYLVHLEAFQQRLEVEKQGLELARVLVRFEGGRTIELDAHRVEPNCFSVIVGTKVYEFDCDVLNGEIELHFGNKPLVVSILDEREALLQKAKEGTAIQGGEVIVTAPMPGKVVAILVAKGENVEKGQGLAVIEAMKMENELKSPIDGVVLKIFAQEGQATEGKAPLVTIGQATPSP